VKRDKFVSFLSSKVCFVSFVGINSGITAASIAASPLHQSRHHFRINRGIISASIAASPPHQGFLSINFKSIKFQ
jgi:hypothetical protein